MFDGDLAPHGCMRETIGAVTEHALRLANKGEIVPAVQETDQHVLRADALLKFLIFDIVDIQNAQGGLEWAR